MINKNYIDLSFQGLRRFDSDARRNLNDFDESCE